MKLLGMTEPLCIKSPREQNPLILAYLGDAIYEVFVRHRLIAQGIVRPHDLQKAATRYVSAVAQATVCRQIEVMLTEEESDILRRGRNAKSGSVPKSAKVSDYRTSTGLEALIGYLYLMQNEARLQEIMQMILTHIEKGAELK